MNDAINPLVALIVALVILYLFVKQFSKIVFKDNEFPIQFSYSSARVV